MADNPVHTDQPSNTSAATEWVADEARNAYMSGKSVVVKGWSNLPDAAKNAAYVVGAAGLVLGGIALGRKIGGGADAEALAAARIHMRLEPTFDGSPIHTRGESPSLGPNSGMLAETTPATDSFSVAAEVNARRADQIEFDATGLSHPSGAFDKFEFAPLPHARAQHFKFAWTFPGTYDDMRTALGQAGLVQRDGFHFGKTEFRSPSSVRGQIHLLVEHVDPHTVSPFVKGSVHGLEYDPLVHPIEHLFNDVVPLAFARREMRIVEPGMCETGPVRAVVLGHVAGASPNDLMRTLPSDIVRDLTLP